MTPEEYLALPEEKPYLEYVDGMVLQKPMPSYDHGALQIEIGSLIREWIRAHDGYVGGDVRTRLGDLPNYRLPDVSFWSPGARPTVERQPSLAIEIRSPDQTMAELRTKCRFFRSNGVQTCWLIDPQSRIAEVFDGQHDGEHVGADGVLTTECMPGFELHLRDLFSLLSDQDDEA